MIVKLMDALGARQADVIGHDIGGGVAQLIAVNHPEKVRKLVLSIVSVLIHGLFQISSRYKTTRAWR